MITYHVFNGNNYVGSFNEWKDAVQIPGSYIVSKSNLFKLKHNWYLVIARPMDICITTQPVTEESVPKEIQLLALVLNL